MAEVYTFAEASAYAWTGSTSGILAFVQNAQITLEVGRHSYRSPGATTRTYIETGRQARVTIERMRSDTRLAVLMQNSTGGSLHVHLKAAHLGLSAGFFLWSGELQSLSHNEREGGAWTENVMGVFQAWSAY
jgi:hypothetical protein